MKRICLGAMAAMCPMVVFAQRFPDYANDIDGDPRYSFIDDLWSVLKDMLTVPADLFRAWSYGTDFGKFFEVTCAETSGSSFLLSAMVVIALVYSQAERLLVYLKSKRRLDTER